MINAGSKLGLNIKKLRHEQNISQEALAEKCGLHRTYLSGIERGERNPSLINLVKIASSLNVSLSELFLDV